PAFMSDLWVDPWEYRNKLEAAALYLDRFGMQVSVYNHQLCTIPKPIWRFSRKAISDWKNEFLPGCSACVMRGDCGGFFSSSIRRRFSDHIRPLTTAEVDEPESHPSDSF
ncbi:MAG TPA: hypothetical protein VMQ62_01680, partial [Dongiaceae bacterium]|nr:hypothetical protein [Dongiaceae bacterium]